jgi:hypothetical protein
VSIYSSVAPDSDLVYSTIHEMYDPSSFASLLDIPVLHLFFFRTYLWICIGILVAIVSIVDQSSFIKAVQSQTFFFSFPSPRNGEKLDTGKARHVVTVQ